jgi:hypothetical protein
MQEPPADKAPMLLDNPRVVLGGVVGGRGKSDKDVFNRRAHDWAKLADAYGNKEQYQLVKRTALTGLSNPTSFMPPSPQTNSTPARLPVPVPPPPHSGDWIRESLFHPAVSLLFPAFPAWGLRGVWR